MNLTETRTILNESGTIALTVLELRDKFDPEFTQLKSPWMIFLDSDEEIVDIWDESSYLYNEVWNAVKEGAVLNTETLKVFTDLKTLNADPLEVWKILELGEQRGFFDNVEKTIPAEEEINEITLNGKRYKLVEIEE